MRGPPPQSWSQHPMNGQTGGQPPMSGHAPQWASHPPPSEQPPVGPRAPPPTGQTPYWTQPHPQGAQALNRPPHSVPNAQQPPPPPSQQWSAPAGGPHQNWRPSPPGAPRSIGNIPPAGIPGMQPPRIGDQPPHSNAVQPRPVAMRPGQLDSSMVNGPSTQSPPVAMNHSNDQPLGGLPVPFHGQAQYSHQLHLHAQTTGSTTPTPGSDPQSRKSSRGPSPVSNQQYEMLEGQFNSSKPGTPQPGMQPRSAVMRNSPQSPGKYSASPRQMDGFMEQPGAANRQLFQGFQAASHGGQTPPLGGPPPPHGGPVPPHSSQAASFGVQASPHGGQASSYSSPASPLGGPVPPLGGPVPPLGGPVPPLGGPAPPLGGPAPPLGGPAPPLGGPTPLAGPAPPVGGPAPPPNQTMQQPPTGPPPVHGQQPSRPPFASSEPTASQPIQTSVSGRRVYPQMPQQQQPPQQWQQQQPQQWQPQQSQQQNAMPAPHPARQTTPGDMQSSYQSQQQPTNSYGGYQSGLNSTFGRMHMGSDASVVNLLHEKHLIPPEGVETPRPCLQNDYKKVNCSPDVFRCTLNAVPQTQSLLSKSRLPLGILIHPFKDLSSLPVIQSSVIVRCRSCRTYINPFVTFVDQRRWRCNLCFRVNEMPDEFTFDPVSKTYGAPERRPEIRSATVEFIAPSEYMLRPPQPAVYLYVLDTSFSSIETGYLQCFCSTLLEELDRMPGDGRTKIGFITFDSAVRFYNLSEGLSAPQVLVVTDIDDVFIPSPEGLLVNFNECRDLVVDLLNELPSMFQGNKETYSATGAALQAAMKLMTPTGGRLTLMQGCLPNAGPGLLKARENPNERAGKNIVNLGPATDFYKKLALDCSAQQIAIDTWFLSGQFLDVATVGCASKYSGGCCYHYPGIHHIQNPAEMERFENDLRRYLTRKIGFEAVMRIRCTKGLSIHTFHGNFFVRSTDLLSLPNINPDAGFGMQISIEDSLMEYPTVSLQAALLYTSGKGERRIRVHTLCLPVTNQMSEIHANADQQAVTCLLAKMAVDRSLSSSFSDARDAMINACVDSLSAFGETLSSSQRVGGLSAHHALRLLPAYILALLKSVAFRIGTSTKLDDRVYAMEQCKNLPLQYLMLKLYPSLYPVHALDQVSADTKGDNIVPKLQLHLSSAYLDRHGAYVLDVGDALYLWIGGAISDVFVQQVFDVPNFMSIQDGMNELPELNNPLSENLRALICYLQDQRPHFAKLQVIRDDSRSRMLFLQYMVEDRSESAMSYYEFLQHIKKQVK